MENYKITFNNVKELNRHPYLDELSDKIYDLFETGVDLSTIIEYSTRDCKSKEELFLAGFAIAKYISYVQFFGK